MYKWHHRLTTNGTERISFGRANPIVHTCNSNLEAMYAFCSIFQHTPVRRGHFPAVTTHVTANTIPTAISMNVPDLLSAFELYI